MPESEFGCTPSTRPTQRATDSRWYMSGPGYLHPFLPGVIYANGAGEEIRTVRSVLESSA